MSNVDFMKSLTQSGYTKAILLVMDGLGGLPREVGGPRNLKPPLPPTWTGLRGGFSGTGEHCRYRNNPWKRSWTFRAVWIRPTGTSYWKTGVLEAVGIGLSLTEQDVAARGNLCTVDQDGFITTVAQAVFRRRSAPEWSR